MDIRFRRFRWLLWIKPWQTVSANWTSARSAGGCSETIRGKEWMTFGLCNVDPACELGRSHSPTRHLSFVFGSKSNHLVQLPFV